MEFYISLFIFFLFGIIKNEILRFKKSNFLIFLIIFLFCFSYQMGTDWLVYQNYYENIVFKFSWDEIFKSNNTFEIGYIVLNLFFYNLGISYQIYIGIILSLCTFVILKYIQKNSNNYYLSFFIFLILYLLTALIEPLVRQLIALTFFILSLKYIEKGNILKYILLIFFATLFHKSAYFLMPLYFIKYIDFSLKKLLIVLFFFKMFLEKILFIILFYFERYYNYLYFGRYSIHKQMSLNNIFMLFLYITIIFFIYGKDRNKNIYNFSILFIIIYFFSPYFNILSRMNFYFSPFISIGISYVSTRDLRRKKTSVFCNNILIRVFKVTFLFLVFIGIFYRKSINSELFKFAYLNYKNYFIELLKGEIKKDFNEKSKEYKKQIETLMKNER